jgi:hypothetical protein
VSGKQEKKQVAGVSLNKLPMLILKNMAFGGVRGGVPPLARRGRVRKKRMPCFYLFIFFSFFLA